MDSASERGISGALALWGPLIIIGFLVLVLNTDDAPEAPSRTEAAAAASSLSETVAPAEALPAPPVAETAAPEEEAVSPAGEARVVEAPAAEPAESEVSVATVEPAAQSVGSDAPAAATALEEPDVVAAVPQVATVAAEEPAETPSREEPPVQVAAGAGLEGDIDLDAVLEVARSVIGQGGGEAPLEIAGASGSPPAPALSEVPASASPPPREAPPRSRDAGRRERFRRCIRPLEPASRRLRSRDSDLVHRQQSLGGPAVLSGRGHVGRGGRVAGGRGGQSRLASSSGLGCGTSTPSSRYRDASRIGILAPASGAGALRAALVLVHRPAGPPLPSCPSWHVLARLPLGATGPVSKLTVLWRGRRRSCSSQPRTFNSRNPVAKLGSTVKLDTARVV